MGKEEPLDSFQNIFVQLVNDKIIDSQSESIPLYKHNKTGVHAF